MTTPLNREPQDVLQSVFGYDAFRRQQAQIIDAVCSGRDALVIMPTGGGKSICYQVPAIARTGMTIVVSPLIALMRDQVMALDQLGVSSAFLNSSLSGDAQRHVIDRAVNGSLDLLYVAPERLLQPETLETLQRCHVNLIAIDEAHCVSAWGHDFRQDYLQLHQLRGCFPDVPYLALTATADRRTRDDIVERLQLSDPAIFIDGFDRPNICYTVQPKGDARSQLAEFMADRPGEAGIVYCLSRKSVERTAEWLCLSGRQALPYHAGLDSETRQSHQETFLREEGIIMVATIAFGMGIDKPDVRFVAHLDLPKSVEAYYQETGRAGRDGAPADAWMIYGLQDVVRLSRMNAESQASEAHRRIERSKLDALLGWCEVTSCRRQALLAYFGESSGGDCGNCDVCLRPPATWDGTEAAQKALSCVYRTGQRFGAAHVVDVLRGQRNEKVLKFGHERLSTYGIGDEFSDSQWRSILRQLVVRGYLQVDHERYGALTLTPTSRELLRGEVALSLREDPLQPKRRRQSKSYSLEIEDEEFMDALRELRKRLADEAGVPPYVVCHDATLLEMVVQRPRTEGELLQISGIGQAKLARYGQQFLDVVSTFHPTPS